MGLLTDPHSNGRLTPLLQHHATKISILCYCIGVIWFGLLAWEPCNNKTYFSENALLPGLVQREFNMGNVASQMLDTLKEEATKHPGIPYTWLQAQFRQLGLDVYLHNFTLHYPFGSKHRYPGKNVYAILRAPRASSMEAIVLSTPYRDVNNMHGTTLPSVALMLSLAKFFRKQIYWAKDIIFLITDHELVGFQAWLEAYHSSVTAPEVLESGILYGRSGAIQAAVNLEIPFDRISHFNIKIEGLNGQLPNLDLFNLMVEMCLRENVVATFHGQANPLETQSWDGWLQALRTMLDMLTIQSTGAPSGGHGLFHRFAIQALTIEGHGQGFDLPKASFTQMGRVLEGIFRSLNNLLERFHQSFFFYLLPTSRRYVSIGLYMPAFALISSPVLLQALSLYLSLNGNSANRNIPSAAKEKSKPVPSLWGALPMVMLTHFLGYLMCQLPVFVDHLGHSLEMPFKDTLYGSVCIFLVTAQILLLAAPFRKYDDNKAHRCMALLALGAFLYTLALVNISSATILAVIYVPVAITSGVFSRRCGRFLQSVLLFLIQPLVLTYLIVLTFSVVGDRHLPLSTHVTRSYEGHKKLLLYNVEDWFLYGSYNYVGVAAFLVPIWLQLWLIPS